MPEAIAGGKVRATKPAGQDDVTLRGIRFTREIPARLNWVKPTGINAAVAVIPGTVFRSLRQQNVHGMSAVLIPQQESKKMNDTTHKTDAGLAGDTATMSDAELGGITAGDPKGYHECVLGSVNGGGPGLYPLYIVCRLK